MKAYEVGAGSLNIAHIERPELQPTEVLINYRDKPVVNLYENRLLEEYRYLTALV